MECYHQAKITIRKNILKQSACEQFTKSHTNALNEFRSLSEIRMTIQCGGFPSIQVVKNPPTNEGAAGDTDSIPGLGKSPGEKRGNPL